MKRMLALLLAVMMLSSLSAAGSAESYDLSELSDNALVKLYELLQQEMKSRGLLGQSPMIFRQESILSGRISCPASIP